MKVNIYYGGRGVLEDPTNYVIKVMETALSQLQVEVVRYNIYEQKNSVSTLVNTISGVDGIILATTVEWMGIGGFMTRFLDDLWFYANKDEISRIYMQPVVMSTTYGERESLLALENAWQILGGISCAGLCGYVEDLSSFEENFEYRKVIEKKAENLYRTISSKSKELPNSNKAVSQTVLRTKSLNLTPQESEQLSFYAADDEYVEQKKQDIIELSKMYRDLLGQVGESLDQEYINSFKSHFNPIEDFVASYQFEIEGQSKPLLIQVAPEGLSCDYGETQEPDVLARLSSDTLNNIINGRMSFLQAFSKGDMTAKGKFAVLRKLDELFVFA